MPPLQTLNLNLSLSQATSVEQTDKEGFDNPVQSDLADIFDINVPNGGSTGTVDRIDEDSDGSVTEPESESELRSWMAAKGASLHGVRDGVVNNKNDAKDYGTKLVRFIFNHIPYSISTHHLQIELLTHSRKQQFAWASQTKTDNRIPKRHLGEENASMTEQKSTESLATTICKSQ